MDIHNRPRLHLDRDFLKEALGSVCVLGFYLFSASIIIFPDVMLWDSLKGTEDVKSNKKLFSLLTYSMKILSSGLTPFVIIISGSCAT